MLLVVQELAVGRKRRKAPELRSTALNQHNPTENPRILRILNLNLAFQVKMKIHLPRQEAKLSFFLVVC